MDFDKILAKCGDSGRYQYLILGLLGYIAFTSTLHYYSQNIISFVPEHWCHHPLLENRSYAQIEAIYKPFGKLASCTRLDAIEGDNVTVSSERCAKWIYKYDYGFRSINAEMNWVCDDAYKARIGQSLFFVGSLLGTLTFGLLGDRLGRVPTLILANQCGFIGDFCTSYAANLTQFAVCRFISGWSADANFYLMFILVLEYLSPRMRNIHFNITLGVSNCLGSLAASWLAVLAGNWRIYLTFMSLSLLAVALFYFVVQESAQWLITRNDADSAIARLKYIAHFNGRQVPAADFDAFRSHCAEKRQHVEQQPTARLLDILRTPRLRRTALIVGFMFMLNVLVFNTITRNVEGLGLSPFVVFSLFGLVIPIAGVLQAHMQTRLGRKATVILAMLATGLLCCAMAVALSVEQWQGQFVLFLALTLPMRLGSSMCYTCASLYSSELIPTCVRSRGLAAAHVAGAGISFLSPYLIHMGVKFAAGPSLILAVVLMVCALATLRLPETLNRQLPITLADGEAFGRGESMLSFECWRRPADEEETKSTHSIEELELMQSKTKPLET
ncbi:organic cation transporter protein-like [Scaptodrosophila lebanonensis]|uniref:Organic cation transporter protein-like n=1 Tax=Drosophila lebanonensis TaxID=7225 RepID=A0A6J2T5S7_DROLE|nr:organic cation transporter protein-like [Scaptodrosophila lebanonensis]